MPRLNFVLSFAEWSREDGRRLEGAESGAMARIHQCNNILCRAKFAQDEMMCPKCGKLQRIASDMAILRDRSMRVRPSMESMDLHGTAGLPDEFRREVNDAAAAERAKRAEES